MVFLPDMNVEELANAIQIALNPQSQPHIREQATKYCLQIRESKDGFMLAIQLYAEGYRGIIIETTTLNSSACNY